MAKAKRRPGTILKAAFNRAASPGKGGAIIPTSPLEGVPLPPARKRAARVVVEGGENEQVMALVKSPEVRDILTVLWETGNLP